MDQQNTPEFRICDCGCGREFAAKGPKDQRKFFDRKCASVFNAGIRGKASKRTIQTKSGVKPKRSMLGSRKDLEMLRDKERPPQDAKDSRPSVRRLRKKF